MGDVDRLFRARKTGTVCPARRNALVDIAACDERTGEVSDASPCHCSIFAAYDDNL